MEDKENLEIENEEIIEDVEEEVVDNSEELERAKKLGYKDGDEYTGNPKYKLSPKEYLERAEKGGTIKKLESDITEMRSAFEKMQKFTQLQVQSARDRALEELKIKQAKSVDEDGVSASVAFDNYEREKVKVEKQYTPEPERETEAPEITKFYQENPWYKEDVVMQGAANALHRSIVNKHPDKPLDEQLRLVKQEIIKNFPERFENPKRKVQSIEGGQSGYGGVVTKKDTFQSLGFSNSDIADARKLIKAGDFKDEADFVKSYTLLNKGKK